MGNTFIIIRIVTFKIGNIKNRKLVIILFEIVLEQRGTDYVFIEDYIDDIGLLF